MALDTFVAGAYSGSFNGAAVGLTANGFNLIEEIDHEVIQADYFGRSIIDGLTQGGNAYCEFECQAYKAASLAAGKSHAAQGVLPTPGLLLSNLALALVLTSTTGTPAESAPASVTGSKAVTANGHRLQLALNSRLRTVPVRHLLLPYLSTVYRNFSVG